MGYEEALRLIEEAAETGATELDLSYQSLTELPPELFELNNLTELDLNDNQLSSLPPELGQLSNLTLLDLRYNQLSSLPSSIAQLSDLTWLDLGLNELSSPPPELFQLKNLTTLGLSDNQLIKLPPELFQLNKLEKLNLSGNQLTSLPPQIVQLPKLKGLWFRGNPLVSPPIEIAIQGIKAIREYFAEVEGETREVAEVKVILVGEGASGKTSLTRCLHGEQFNPHEATTHGIRIKRWKLSNIGQSVRGNFWDFGGQEIMHATHQFFLSRNALYILVLDGRRDERTEYWLRYIETFGGRSPVLVVLNKYDINPSFDLNRPFLLEKYPFIVGFHRTSCLTGEGIEPFRQALLEELDNVPLSRNRWPAAWFRAKERLEQMNEPRISYEKFEGILADAGVKGESTRNVLAAFLHDLGIVIHFDTFELKDHHVLDPKWVTGAVYKIINAPRIAEAKGLLRLDKLEQILHWQEGDEYRYWPADHVYIIELMKQFELCYELPDKQVLIPQLLGVSEPAFAFDYSRALRFELRYEDFLPPSVMPRFIVKRHQEIAENLRWRSGVVLQHPQLDARAVVRADNEARRIHIAVTGKERKVFLALIWLTFRELHTGFEGLKVSERIPLPDQPAISVDYQTLLNNLEQGVERFVPEGTNKAYSVQELLAGVHFDDPSEGERMLALATADSKTEREKMQEMLRRYERRVKNNESSTERANKLFTLEPSIFGVGLNLNALFDELLRRHKK
ncbi:MAG: COR domain-containing protein [Candidatus Electrothrix aestuarii]|uniref:non-specific serine/threonine protein kinase n=1 Tax=Candidatus Electrothrix aestuarii TaxID=3062594 RepID=A0AAU8M100_9BACT|nr:COR domain-containing protein [Candidatus Electrothrix aestuarii]